MKNLPVKLLLPVTVLGILAFGLAAPVRADDGHGKSQRSLVVKGVITDVKVTDSGRILTIDRGEVDDVAADDVLVRLVPDTGIEPKGAVPVKDMAAVAVVKSPADDQGVYTAKNLVLKVKPDKPGRDPLDKPLRACGTIAALPADDPILGQWTLTIPDLADLVFTVNDQTKIVPKDVKPAVGDAACVLARHTDSGWVAEMVQLQREDDDQDDHARRVELRGTVTELRQDGTIVIDVEGRGLVEIQRDADTEVEGDLVVGAKVVVRAKALKDDEGNEYLLAEKIKVLGGEHPGGKDANAAVVLKGTVKGVTGNQWTIDSGGTEVIVTVADTTKIIGLGAGDSPVDREVKGVAKRQADGTLLAVMLHLKK